MHKHEKKNHRDQSSNRDLYVRLADALNRHPEGFPRTESGIEITILMKILSLDEAKLAIHLTPSMETAHDISVRANTPVAEVQKRLLDMASKGRVWKEKSGNKGPWKFRMAPFIPGFYEEHMVATRDKELLHLMVHYAQEGGLQIMTPTPALQRVLPATDSLGPEVILPYDDIKKLISEATSFALFDCTCRVTRDMQNDRPCDKPLKTCLQLFYDHREKDPHSITKRKALSVLDESEAAGLVHTATNYGKGIHWICNCCGCCCYLIRNLVEEGLEGAIAKANYRAVIDRKTCNRCKICTGRCPVAAITINEKRSSAAPSRCIGCGLCVTTCPAGAISLVRLPNKDINEPPVDGHDFQHKRLHNRGIR